MKKAKKRVTKKKPAKRKVAAKKKPAKRRAPVRKIRTKKADVTITETTEGTVTTAQAKSNVDLRSIFPPSEPAPTEEQIIERGGGEEE